MSINPEKMIVGQETGVESRQTTENLVEKLNNKSESEVELSPRDLEARAEKARAEALETAVSVESGGKEKEQTDKKTVSVRRGSIGKKERENSFNQTIALVQNDLPIVSRTFSKIIHNKVMEKTSEAVGNVIARPNAILSGAVFAFILSLITYTTAKTIGYRLSGFETIGSFAIGWLVGIIYDYFKVLFTGKKY